MITPRTLRRGLGLAVLVATVQASVTAFAGGLIVSPVIIDTSIKKSGDTLPPVKVTNDSGEDWEITVEFLPLGHDLSGAPTGAPESYRYSGHKLLSVKKPKFKLGAGQSTNLEVKVAAPAGRAGGAYAAMYVLGKPVKNVAESITSYVRVGVLIELTLPGTAKRMISPGKVYAVQDGGKGPITIFAAATVKGDVHEKIGGVVVVTNDKGAQVATVNLEPANVFPTMTRNIKATWKAPATLAKGKYKLTATLSATGTGKETAYGTLEMVKPGEAARHTMLVTKFQTPPVVQKTAVALEASVQNQGNVAFAPVGRVTYLTAKGDVAGTARLQAAAPVAAGQKGALKGSLAGGLAPGSYTAKLEVMNDADFVLANFTSTQQVIEKEVKLAGKISKFTGPSAKEAFVTLEWKNEGNVEVDAEGIVMVADSSGNVVGQIPLEKQHIAVGGSASYKRGLPDGLSQGLYELRAVVNFGGATPSNQTLKHFVQ